MQIYAAELAMLGKMSVVGSVVAGPACELGEMIERAAALVEELVLPEVAGSQEH